MEECTSVVDYNGFSAAGNTDDLIITNFTVQGSSGYSMHFDTVHQLAVRHCSLIPLDTDSIGIRIQNCYEGIFEDCEVENQRRGIYIRSSENITVKGSTVSYGGPGIPPSPPPSSLPSYGIDIGNLCSDINIIDCVVDNTNYGIMFQDSNINCILFNATVSNSETSGLYLSSSNVEAWNVMIIGANDTGIQSYDSILNITNSSISASTLYDLYLDLDSNITTLNTTFDKALVQYVDTESTLTVRWFMHVYVVLPDLTPLVGADVTVKDVNAVSIFSGISNADGMCRWIKCTEYVQNQIITTHYAPYNVTATIFSSTSWAMPEAPMERTSDVYVVFMGNGYNIYLQNGWNFISLPYEPYVMTLTNLEEILFSIDGRYDIVQWYDPTDSMSPWKSYNVNYAGTQGLTHLNHTMGFWIKTLEDCTLLSVGELPMSTNIPLYTGWNMVGYPSSTPRQAQTTLPGWGTTVTKIGYYNGSAQYGITETTDGTFVMSAGNAYWVYTTTDTTWTMNW